MATGIIIHVSSGRAKLTEFFSDERIRIGPDDTNDLQIRNEKLGENGTWLELERADGIYRVINFSKDLEFKLNDKPLRRFLAIGDGDTISIGDDGVLLSFFALAKKSALIKTNREPRHVAQFIEEAALDSAASTRPDEAKAFLREFVRELLREIKWTTKLIILVLAVSTIGGFLYLGFGFYRELRQNRQQSEQQNEEIRKLQGQLAQNNEQMGNIDKTNKDLLRSQSLAPNLRLDYGNGICLIVGVYDLVDRKNGKTLRYPDPYSNQPDPFEPTPAANEEGIPKPMPPKQGLTTEGNGTPIEYDFIGTGFHVGNGYLMTNRHVLQPWEEDEMIGQLIKQSGGKARIKKLVVYFPNFPQPFPIKVQQVGISEDLGVATIDPNLVSPDIPVLPLDTTTDSVAIGKTVVTMGYPNGPDRLLAMLDDAELKSINAKFGNSRQALISYLAQNKKITPLTTPGAITDLDTKRIVHDAKTAEGGSGAPLFGASGKVIGVNFGVFTENTASNMAIPIRFAIELLKRVGWKPPEDLQSEPAPSTQASTSSGNPESTPVEK